MVVLPLLSALCALALFVSAAPPGLTWQHGGADGGELAAAAAMLGVAHPTGYPLWVLLAHLWLTLPLPGTPAYALNLFSAVASAGAVAALTATLLTLLPASTPTPLRAVAGVAPPLLLAASPAYWQQSIIIEVYALHFLLLAAILLAWARLRVHPSLGRAAVLGAAVGLALAHHVTALLVLPGLALALALDRGRLRQAGVSPVRAALVAGVATLPGLALYGLLPLWAARQAVMNWGDPRTLDNFVAHVTAAAYQSYLRDMPMLAALARVPVAARLLLDQVGWPGFFFIVWGVWAWFHEPGTGTQDTERTTHLPPFVPDGRPAAALVLAASAAVLAHALHYNARDSQVYLIPMYLLLTLPLGRGILAALMAIRDVAAGSGKREAGSRKQGLWSGLLRSNSILPWRPASLLLACTAAALLLWPAAAAAWRWGAVSLRDDRAPEQWTAAVLAAAPNQAVLVTHEDRLTFTLWYAQVVEGRRPDLLVLDARLLGRPWYLDNLRRLHPGLPWPPPGATLPLADLPAFVRDIGERPLLFTFSPTGIATAPIGSNASTLYRLLD